jgi:hypothetical protein
MSDNPMLRMYGLASQATNASLAAIADIQNERVNRKLKRQALEEDAINADRRFRLEEANSDSIRKSRAFNDQYREEAFKHQVDHKNRELEASGLETLEKSLTEELDRLETQALADEINGKPNSEVNKRLEAVRAQVEQVRERKIGTLSGTYQPVVPEAPTQQSYVPYPQRSQDELGFEAFGPPAQQPAFKVDARTRDELGATSTKGNRIVSLDYNSSSSGGNYAMIVIPDDATEQERAAANDYVTKTTEWFRANGVAVDDPVVKTRSENVVNGKPRGAGGFFHTEPAFVQNKAAMQMLQDKAPEYAQILAGTLGQIQGTTFIPPHKANDPGAGSPDFLSERDFAKEYILPNLTKLQQGGGISQASSSQGVPDITLSAYTPTKGLSNVSGAGGEGGYEAARPGPDGQAVVRTMDDYVNGRSEYVTIAGNPSLIGKEYTIPSITYIDADGNEKVLKNVPAVLHDTGSAFKDVPEGRFDLPIGRDKSYNQLITNHAKWKEEGVQFIPKDKWVGPATETSPTATPMPRATPVEFFEPEVEQEVEGLNFFEDEDQELDFNGNPTTTTSSRVNFRARTQDQVRQSPANAISLSMGQPEPLAKLTAEKAKSIMTTISTKFGQDPKKVRMLGAALQDRILRESPDIFDDELETLAASAVNTGVSRTDFTASLPDHVKAVGLDARAVDKFTRLKGVKEKKDLVAKGLEDIVKEEEVLENRIKNSRIAVLDYKSKIDDPSSLEKMKVEEAHLETEMGRLELLRSRRRRLTEENDMLSGAAFGDALSGANQLIGELQATDGADMIRPPQEPTLADNIINGLSSGSNSNPRWNQLIGELGDMGIEQDLLAELPLADLDKPLGFGEAVFGGNQEIQGVTNYVAKALYETNQRKFNRLGPEEQQAFKEGVQLKGATWTSPSEMDDMVTLFGQLGLALPKKPTNPTMARKMTLEFIKSDAPTMYSLLRMVRTNAVDQAASMVRAARVQTAQAKAKKTLDKANALLDIPQD